MWKTTHHAVILALVALGVSTPVPVTHERSVTASPANANEVRQAIYFGTPTGVADNEVSLDSEDAETRDLSKRQKIYLGTGEPTGLVDEEVSLDSKDAETRGLSKRQKIYFGTGEPTGLVDEEVSLDSEEAETRSLSKRQKIYFGTGEPTGVLDEEVAPEPKLSKRQILYLHGGTGVNDQEIEDQ